MIFKLFYHNTCETRVKSKSNVMKTVYYLESSLIKSRYTYPRIRIKALRESYKKPQ